VNYDSKPDHTKSPNFPKLGLPKVE